MNLPGVESLSVSIRRPSAEFGMDAANLKDTAASSLCERAGQEAGSSGTKGPHDHHN